MTRDRIETWPPHNALQESLTKEKTLGRIISTHSFRGGTGKSNTTANLATLMAKEGFRVGVIDTDIQSPGIHVLFQLGESAIDKTLNDYLWHKCTIEQAAYNVSLRTLGIEPQADAAGQLFLIPSSLRTGEIARVLREGYDVSRLTDGFHDLLDRLKLDYLFIDTHPGVNEETLLSIAVSDCLVLLVRPDQQDFQGTAVTIELARKLNVPDMFVVINKAPPDFEPVKLADQVQQLFKTEVFAVLPLSLEMAKVASNDLFCNRFPNHSLTEQFKSIVRRLR